MMGSKSKTFRVPVFLGSCCVLLASCSFSEAAPPDAAAIAAITEAAPKTAARPQKPRKLLAYTRANGFRHSSIETGAQALTILGQKTGAWTTVVSDDPASFKDLSSYDAVVFVSTTGDCFLPGNFNDLDEAAKAAAKANEAQYKTNLLDFVSAGKGFAGIHSATDTMYGWPEYGQMIGGYFDGHPWGSGDDVTVRVEDKQSPITQGLNGESLSFKEELYQFRDPFSRKQQRVLMGIDLDKTAPKNGMKRDDRDYPVTWIKTQGAGRVFYCSLGHNEAMYTNPKVLGVYLSGIQYALGDLKADTTPLAQLPTIYSDPVMGEYAFIQPKMRGAIPPSLVRIFPEGDGKYRAVANIVGTKAPVGPPHRVELTGTLQDNAVAFAGMDGDAEIKANWSGGELSFARGTDAPVKLSKYNRISPTLAQKPPVNSVVLLPYSTDPNATSQGPSLDAWTTQSWIPLRDGSVQVRGGDNRTKKEFGDVKLHVEWLTPLKPEARGQERGNSGVYLQDRYEIQVLDSFGLDVQDNDAGGIYQIAKPLLNASLPPGQWQTYDITFRAPRLYADGNLAKPAVVTIELNGVVIQKDIEIPRSTGGGADGFAAKAPIRLQDHGNPVRYRNIWVQELTDQPWTPPANPAAAIQ